MLKKISILGITLFLCSCKAPSKDSDKSHEIIATEIQEKKDYQNYTDGLGEQLSISTDEETNVKTIKFNGNTYILEKDEEYSSYSTSDNEFQLTETSAEITFLKKDYNMVLFKTKKKVETQVSKIQ